MTRIQVRPDELVRLSGELKQIAGRLREAGARLGGAVSQLSWQVGQRLDLEAQAAGARRQAELLADEAEGMARFLDHRAELFRSADGQGTEDLGRTLAAFSASEKFLRGKLGRIEALDRWSGWAVGGSVAAGTIAAVEAGIRGRHHEVFGSPSARVHPELGDGAPAVVESDPFWASVGPVPVVDGQFTPQFQTWVDVLNRNIEQNWSDEQDDHAGTVGAEVLKSVYRLTPAKVEQLWAFARENHVDPRLLLAILQQEGTGSFNTNAANAEAYEGHGPQPDWNKDLTAALEGPVLSKLRLYAKAVEGGFPGTWVEWVNWYTPIDSEGFQGAPGVYAADINWSAGVAGGYGDVAKALGSTDGDPVSTYGRWMGENGQLFHPRHIEGDFVVKPGLPPGATRPTLALWHEFQKPDVPGTTGPKKGFWWFPAPDSYCWHIERR
ncbi:MAG TPA: hypothetical protein VNT01_04450 [Symbiobacteriaceae bacterium]|nr:hypothetical protein [Symbiobacteriaceae bacterium]